jgi:hypothetical protein
MICLAVLQTFPGLFLATSLSRRKIIGRVAVITGLRSRLGYIRFRICQSSRETASQSAVEPVRTNQALWAAGRNRLTSRAKTSRARLPIAAPAASTLAAFLPRCGSMQSGTFFFLLFVLLDEGRTRGKDCGERQEKAADTRTEFLGDDTRDGCDQSTKKETDCELVPASFSQGGRVNLDSHGLLPYPHVPNSERQKGPNWQGENGHPESADFAMHQHPTHAGRIGEKCHGSGNHGICFRGCVMFPHTGYGES